MSDLISRQAAIDAINTWFELYALSRTMTNTMSIQDMIRALPSAQPEVLACRSGELVQESGDLVKELVKDCISRKMAIDAVKDLPNCRNGFSDTYDKACIIGVLEDLPSAQPHWIPCSERLPDSGRYLVSCSLSVFSPQVVNYDADDGEWFYDGCKSIGYKMPTIHAWMPLPKPYGGESE